MLLRTAFLAAALSGGVETIRIYHPFGDKPLPRWTGGALVGCEQPAPLIYAFDKSGLQVGNVTVRVPEASEINVRRATRGRDGSYAFGGIAYLNSGAAAFLWRVSPDGQRQQAFPTGAYIPVDVAVAADGMIWTAGVQKETAKLSHENYVEHDIVRRFHPDGKPAGSWVAYKGGLHLGQYSFLIAAPDRIGWYPLRGPEYFEFSPDGRILEQYPAAPMSKGQQLKGFALCDDGRAYAGRETYREKGGPEPLGSACFGPQYPRLEDRREYSEKQVGLDLRLRRRPAGHLEPQRRSGCDGPRFLEARIILSASPGLR